MLNFLQEFTSRDEVNAGHQMIHGGGFNYNTANRWFDKTIQVSQVANSRFFYRLNYAQLRNLVEGVSMIIDVNLGQIC